MSGNPLASLHRMRAFMAEGPADPAALAGLANASLQGSGQKIQSELNEYQEKTKKVAEQAIVSGTQVIKNLEKDSALHGKCAQEGLQLLQIQEQFGKAAEAAQKALAGNPT